MVVFCNFFVIDSMINKYLLNEIDMRNIGNYVKINIYIKTNMFKMVYSLASI